MRSTHCLLGDQNYAFYYYMRDAFANQWRRWLTGRFLDGYLGNRKYPALGSISHLLVAVLAVYAFVGTFVAQIDSKFGKVITNFGRLIKQQRALNIFQRGFNELTVVLPSVILANAVLSGEMEIGRSVQATGACVAVWHRGDPPAAD